jgi:hypothetical protein
LPYRHGHAETAQRELATVMSRPGKSTRSGSPGYCTPVFQRALD